MNEIKQNKSYWITWETQRRNKELAKAFGAELKVFDNSELSTFGRYIRSIRQTIQVLKSRPQLVYGQCPSLVLCVLLALLKPVFKYLLVIDAHNALVRYLYTSGAVVAFLARYIVGSADFIIVTNQGLFSQLPGPQTKFLVLPDKLPLINFQESKPKIFSNNKPNVVFISSFATDEPVLEFLKAAKNLSDRAKFFITGKKSKASALELQYESEDIVFTDFLSEKNYEALISHADLNIDLTLFDQLLVCGAYETLAVGVPGMLSDTPIQRETFNKGFTFTFCDSDSIQRAIVEALKCSALKDIEISDFKEDFVRNWDNAFNVCKNRIIIDR